MRNFQKLIKYYKVYKILHYRKKFLLENPFLMFLANFIFVVSHLKIHSAVHLNTSKALTSLKSKRKVHEKYTSFRYSCALTRVFYIKNRIRVPACTNRADKNSNTITLVTIIIMLL